MVLEEKSKNEKLSELRAILQKREENSVMDAAAYLLTNIVKNKPKKAFVTELNASLYLLQYVQCLLDRGLYLEAANLLWTDEMFNVRPRSVRMIWDKLPKISELIIMGAGSMGKSYSMAVWTLLDWIRDPEGTGVKVISSTQEHAKRNVFAHIKNLHECAMISLPGVRMDKWIQVGDNDRCGIHLQTIPVGQNGKGTLRGFHPSPRTENHPQFGSLTRVRVILDEAEEIPSGVWEDVDNLLITKDGLEHIKIMGASNPRDRNSKFGKRCTPEGGWPTVNIEESEEWKSDLGWDVIRLDGSRCENVEKREIVYAGLQTWDGYERYLKLGDNSPEYFTMARGWFPEQGLQSSVIPDDFIERSKGSYIFTGKVIYCAAVDLAFEGGDHAPMTIGRWGMAVGWNPLNGKTIMFPQSRYALQVESQFDLEKTHTNDMADQIIEACKNLKIPPDWLIVDRTGNGTGVHDMLKLKYGANVMGLNYGEKATHRKVLDDDTMLADELYDGVVTELFFATRKFIEFEYLKFGPSLRLERLQPELTGRRYNQKKKEKVRVESKKEFRSRGNKSPDYADSLTLLVHVVRLRSDFTATMLATSSQVVANTPEIGYVDKLNFINFDQHGKE